MAASLIVEPPLTVRRWPHMLELMVDSPHFMDEELRAQKGTTAIQGYRWDSNLILYDILSRATFFPFFK